MNENYDKLAHEVAQAAVRERHAFEAWLDRDQNNGPSHLPLVNAWKKLMKEKETLVIAYEKVHEEEHM